MKTTQPKLRYKPSHADQFRLGFSALSMLELLLKTAREKKNFHKPSIMIY